MKRLLFGLLVALILPGLVFAQAKAPAAAGSTTKLSIEFVDGTGLIVTLQDGKKLVYGAGINDGDPIPLLATITTDAKTTAELRLSPNGTIIKLARSTTFKATAYGATPTAPNAFTLAAGKIRTIAAKGGAYDFSSQTAVCGVRGTDFTFDSGEDGKKSFLLVKSGKIGFNLLKDGIKAGSELLVNAGEAADALASVFQAFKYSDSDFQALTGDMGFQKLIETEVPDYTATKVDDGQAASTLAEGAGKMDKAEVESALVKWLREVMGMELGSVTIDGTTYAKAVVQPNFRFNNDKLKFGLYLPIIYSSDMFNPDDWYHPNGNDEWSFGTDIGWKADPLGAGLDAVSDLALKFKYFEYGRQGEDPFVIKLGNLKDFTLGHGLIMRDYANDTEFPSVRRVGFQLGLDLKGFGFEVIANDLADPQIFGGRAYIKPFSGSSFAFGLSGLVDINPLESLTSVSPTVYGDPLLVGAGLDIELPIVKSDFLAIKLFADAAAETEYLRNAITTGSGHAAGLATDLIFNDGFNNWGAAAGLIGRVSILNWRLEYRYYTGVFQPSLFDSTYDKTRAEKAVTYAGYLDGSNAIADRTVMGIYGEGKFSIVRDKLSMTLGYMWPWAPGQSLAWQLDNAPDEFHAKVVVLKGLVPIFDVSGAIFYDKHGLAQSIANGTFQFLDANTTFGGELVIPVPKSPMLDIAVIFAAVPERDGSTGQPILDAAGIPTLKPSISFETRLHF